MVKDFVLPPKLERGDKVAVLATSSGVKERFPNSYDRGLERLKNRFDLEPVIYPTAEKSTAYLYENTEQKAEELMQSFEDPEIKGVIPVTGGDEALRILKHLEPDRLRDNPTRFYGLSDNTNIHFYLWNLGIQSFYGGQFLPDLIPRDEIAGYTFRHLDKAFFEDSLGTVRPSERFVDEFVDKQKDEFKDNREMYDNPGWEFWNFDGKVKGRLFGGCFEIMHFQMATDRYMPDPSSLEGTILALETSEEAPSATEVKRWMMFMGERGLLQKFSAILIGRPYRQSEDGDRTREEKEKYHQEQKETIKKEIKRYCPDTPVVFDMDFGHTDPKIPLQLGAEVEIRPVEEEIEFE